LSGMRGEMFSLLRERRREASIPTEEEEEEEERTELTIGEERGSSSSTEERGNFKPAGLLVERRETGVKAKTAEERTLLE